MVLNAKSLVILMVPAFAGFLALLLVRSRKPFMAHVVFSLHFYAFLMMLFSLALVATAVNVALGGEGLDAPGVDTFLTLVNVTACATYLFLAMGTVYGARGALAPRPGDRGRARGGRAGAGVPLRPVADHLVLDLTEGIACDACCSSPA